MMKNGKIFIYLCLLFLSCSGENEPANSPVDPPKPPVVIERHPIIKISTEYSRYFSSRDGQTWIPISTNYLPDNNLIDIEEYFKLFSQNGGNSMRIWISTSFLEIEDIREGIYSSNKFERINTILQLAKKYNIRIKFTLHHIRSISASSGPENRWSNSTALASRFTDINQYVNTQTGRTSYLNRAAALAAKYKDNEQIYSWELWNEMDASVNENSWYNFTGPMLDSIQKRFPNHLVTQTLGSLHSEYAEQMYSRLIEIPENDFLSIHRYLDEGTAWDQYHIVKGPMDIIASNAVIFGLEKTKSKPVPVIVNEIGAVTPNHAGPSELYEKDKEGVLLHDMLFAPFFSGSAGSGSPWHWNHYIMKNNVWHQFNKFKKAIENADPVKEKFTPVFFEENDVRYYALKGQNKTIIWCRDSKNTWRSEFEEDIPPSTITNLSFEQEKNFGRQFNRVQFYNPWTDTKTNVSNTENAVAIPEFKRSIVIILE